MLEERTVDLPFDGTRLPLVLAFLKAASGIDFEIDPGAKEVLEESEVTLRGARYTVRDALELVLGFTHPDGEVVASIFPESAEAPAGGTISWPVWAPGEVDMPDSITVDGTEISGQIYDGFFGGARTFVAASSEIRDEELIVVPCPIPYMVMVDPASLSG